MNRRSFLSKVKLAAGAAVIPIVATAQDRDTEVRYVPEEFNQVQVQLAGCLMASEGSLETRKVKQGDYAWSLALDRIHELWDKADTLTQRIDKLRQMKDVACAPGTVDYDPYFQGMANGIIFALSVMEEGDMNPVFMDAPKQWLNGSKPSAKRWGVEGEGKINVEENGQ